jgi:hypothetical protein
MQPKTSCERLVFFLSRKNSCSKIQHKSKSQRALRGGKKIIVSHDEPEAVKDVLQKVVPFLFDIKRDSFFIDVTASNV